MSQEGDTFATSYMKMFITGPTVAAHIEAATEASCIVITCVLRCAYVVCAASCVLRCACYAVRAALCVLRCTLCMLPCACCVVCAALCVLPKRPPA